MQKKSGAWTECCPVRYQANLQIPILENSVSRTGPACRSTHACSYPLMAFFGLLFLHSRCWKHKVGEKEEEDIKALRYPNKTTAGCMWDFLTSISNAPTQQHSHQALHWQISSKLSLFALQKDLTMRLYTILLQATRHARKMNQMSSWLFLSSQLFFHRGINGAKWKHCWSQNTQMWRSGKTYLCPYAKGETFTTHHSFTLARAVCLASHWWGQMMHNPSVIYYALSFSRSSSVRSAVARIPRTNESAEAHGFKLFTAR